MNIALLTAGGIGTRAHQDIPKQFIHVENKPIIIYTMEAFQKHPSIDAIIVVGLSAWIEILWAYAKQFNITKLKWVVEGGKTGQESIKNGLMELSKHCNIDDVVLVHDGNRPFVSQDIITDSLIKHKRYGSAIASIPCTEAVFQSEDGIESENTIPREKLYRTQTPHVYKLGKLLWAHEEAEKRGIINTAASCSLMNALGEKIYFSLGSEKNIKITTVEDIEIFKALLHSNNDAWIK
ncbi:2-C-methyl-D-erythritol 4-phosphate cytidylyltransferase [Clostridium beijerinckii]|uniref:2-C-methyl-D-erythritol 4-phosphate cytidylyltransferase n=1 Tax=Clostridium beijerinckii TaxID=1520 RepID=A0AB74VHY1_CLOBE|nr:IspD/TarI family cytidylyltransferase [Clostridium beijerinckii]NRZ25603.1 2-C-methyl-D-erythritol 4-phosphate cytidylyltransferase [Clostridium beijerinckii]NYB98118.1 2-C-methyl-D-erythritol 4-phosphate cytidylyltransferase [Clostridium beijerinckii]OOM23267.1 putative ribitol-5-phosphate cytidylyltransferase [Clostridium beijerinckii]QUN36355.1 2-C-methyl-D-erythritol 4-phosphate cytidylyltransferase [Clostridium beijerinckii]SQB12935.1 2-C-methyl-D-erythritol 4-phosphate cytidylyltransf